MKSVYDRFIEHYARICLSDEVSQDVREGIEAYLGSIGLLGAGADERTNEKNARRELMRFKLMPEQTFAAFFEKYELRRQIDEVLDECRQMAIGRAVSGRLTDEGFCRGKMEELYRQATPLSSDKRYKGWLDEKTRDIAECLKFAAGLSDAVPDAIAESLIEKNEV
jgi:hypothetical protein